MTERCSAAGSHCDHEDRTDGKVNQSVARPYYVLILVPRPSMHAWLEYAWREGLRTRLLEDACCVSIKQGKRALTFWSRCQARQGAYVTDILGLGRGQRGLWLSLMDGNHGGHAGWYL